MKKYIKGILFGCLMLVGGLAMGQNKEVLLLEQMPVGTKQAGVYLYWENKEPEKVEMKDPDLIAQSRVLANVLIRLYKEGWEVASMSAVHSTGLYVLEQEKK